MGSSPRGSWGGRFRQGAWGEVGLHVPPKSLNSQPQCLLKSAGSGGPQASGPLRLERVMCPRVQQGGHQLGALATSQAGASLSQLCVQQAEAEFALSTRKTLRKRDPAPSPPHGPPGQPPGPLLPSLCHRPQSSLRTISQVWQQRAQAPISHGCHPLTLPASTCSHPPKCLSWAGCIFSLLTAPAPSAPHAPPLNNS